MLSMGSTTIHLGFLLKGIPQLSEQVIALVRPKRYNGVYSRDQPRVRQHYEYRWFQSDWMIAHTPIKGWIKMIGPLTDHRDQSMKISSFFNTHYTRISLWNELSQASFYLPTLQVVVQLNQLAQGYPTQILGESVVYKKTNLITSSTQRSGDNLVILLRRYSENHEPPICY